MTNPTAWMSSPAPRPCRTNPEAWFSKARTDQLAAAKECAQCPLLTPCRSYGLADPGLRGVWGGLTETERRKYRAGGPECRTNRGYLRHRAKKEVCPACEEWRTEQVQEARRDRLAEEHAKGGTRTGARIHGRLGESPCTACSTAAYRERQAEWAARPASQKTRRAA